MTEPPRRSQDLKENESRRSKDKFYEILEGHFFGILIGVACIGIGLAFTAPLWFHLFNALYNSIFLFKLFNIDISAGDSVSALRQAILTATGGALAIFTLLETHQKNIREKEKNEQDHIRQVHAERRSRYAKAVEQLADEKAPIRLGGVYTLVKLVDDWLDDKKTLSSEDKRRQEGQIIINSLCAYIRSSFLLAERHEEFSSDYEDYKKKCQNNKIKIHIPQSYKNSIKDFSFGHKNSKYNNQPIQSREEFVRDKSLFQEEQEVRKKILLEIKNRLNGSKPKNKDDRDEIKPGTWSYFEYDFSNAVFFYPVNLSNSYFGASSKFSKTYFIQDASFPGATFTQDADFESANFDPAANFTRATFQRAGFLGAHFEQHVTFRLADFHDAYFQDAIFDQRTIFVEATFAQDTNFSQATFGNKETCGDQRAIFSKAKFEQSVLFSDTTFIEEPDFSQAKFSRIVDPENYEFDISRNSCKIDIKKEEYNGKEFIIPEGADLFDPNDPSEQNSDNSS